MDEVKAMCPHCGRLYVYSGLRGAYPVPGLIPSHDHEGQTCPGTGQQPRNPESDRRPLWSGLANPHMFPDASGPSGGG